MTTADKKSKAKKRLKFLFVKLPIFFGCFLLVMIVALKIVERYPQPLKEGFEKYLSESTGTNASIGVLEQIKLFPNFNIHMRDLTLHNRQNAANTVLESDTVQIIIPLKNILFGGNTIKALNFKNFRADAHLIFPKSLNIANANIVDREGEGENPQYGHFLIADGTYSNSPFSLEAKLDKKGSTYIVPKETSFNLQVGEFSLNALLKKGLTEVSLENAVLVRGGKTGTPQSYDLVKSGEYTKDNPLSCLIRLGGSAECDIYMNENKESATP